MLESAKPVPDATPDHTPCDVIQRECAEVKALCASVIEGEHSTRIYKQALRQGNDYIDRLFDSGEVAIDAIVKLRTRLTDSVLLYIWDSIFTATQRKTMALVAVGGYGRGELHPASDIDIMVLIRDAESRALNEDVSRFITQLWDLGLDIGHSVRTVDECITESINDLTVITNLMEARLLEGNQVLLTLVMESLSPDKTWSSQRFFEGKMKEQSDRRKKFQDTAYRLEPNIKEGPGGLRDIQTIGWISQRHFGSRDLYKLVEENFINRQEYASLIQSQLHLWKIRYLLHRITGKREDRLLFDYQRELAHAFGFTDDEQNRSIEGFMQRHYRTVMQTQRLNELILQRFQEVLSELQEPATVAPINSKFQIRNGYIEVRSEHIFEKYPYAMLEIFEVYAKTADIKGFRADTIRLLRKNLFRINDEFRASPEARKLFMQLFRDPQKLTRKLRRMNRYGVMASYLPEFENIVGRMQYDLFHIYTVDEHTTRVIRNLRRFALPAHRNELPHCSMIMDQVRKPELLYIIGLFHDIAKGRGGDHSELGAELAIKFCENHSISALDTDLVQWTVRNHLIMSMTAQRRDISDPEVIHNFARRVGSREHLNHLYLLTVADIRGTNSDLWNSWKENLLRDLFRYTARALHRGLDAPIDKQETIRLKMQDTRSLLIELAPEADEKEIEFLWEGLGDEYFLRYFPEEIAWHTQAIINHNSETPLVALRKENTRGSTEILIYTHDHSHLFSLVTAELDNLGLNILAANIGTTNTGCALNTFSVLENDNEMISSLAHMEAIKQSLLLQLEQPEILPDIRSQIIPRRLKHFQIEPSITIDNEISERFTAVYIEAADRPGLLSRIGLCLLQNEVNVESAKVATLGEKIEDVFFVTNQHKQQLSDDKILFALHDCLVSSLTDSD